MGISVFVSTDWQSAEQAWIANSGTEKSPSLCSTGDVAPTPEEPASRGALNPFFFNDSLWCYYVLLLSLTVAWEVKIWTNGTYKRVQHSKLLVAFTPTPRGRLFSGGSGITIGVRVRLGHCTVQNLAGSAYSMLCRLGESMGESCQWHEYLFFPSWNGIEST